MRKYFYQMIVISLLSCQTLQSAIIDVPYKFDQSKLQNSKDTFHFLRSFVDYFYLIAFQNKSELNVHQKLSSFSGWCAGDAHPENFGSIILENGMIDFTVNDMDDSGPCPVAFDLLRLMVSSKLYDNDLKLEDILLAYKSGIEQQSYTAPKSIRDLVEQAKQNGIEIDSKKLQGKMLKRKSSSNEVDTMTRKFIVDKIENTFAPEAIKVLDIIETAKASGGSAGMQRYELLVENSIHQLIHLELKELTTPSIYPLATSPIPNQAERMKHSLDIDQGMNESHYYKVYEVDSKFMLLRPKFSGNIGISLSDNSKQDNEEIIYYEAYTLGRLHSLSIDKNTYLNQLNSMDHGMWKSDVEALVNHFNRKFEEIKLN